MSALLAIFGLLGVYAARGVVFPCSRYSFECPHSCVYQWNACTAAAWVESIVTAPTLRETFSRCPPSFSCSSNASVKIGFMVEHVLHRRHYNPELTLHYRGEHFELGFVPTDIPVTQCADVAILYSWHALTLLRNTNDLPRDITSKFVYVPPFVYPYSNHTNRSQDIATTFSIQSIRSSKYRARINRTLSELFPNYRNIFVSYRAQAMLPFIDRMRIMVNIRQNPAGVTIEELRILPALLRGVVVVSETVPFVELIPWHEYVVWCRYQDIAKTVEHVSQNYKYYFDRFFGPDSSVLLMLKDLETTARQELQDRLIAAAGNCAARTNQSLL